jgi:hypothetical protein
MMLSPFQSFNMWWCKVELIEHKVTNGDDLLYVHAYKIEWYVDGSDL